MLGIIVVLNFVSFFVVCMLLGGDALNGRVINGHYFLGSHGKFTETSAAIYRLSAIHAISQFVAVPTWLLASWRAERRIRR